MRILYFYQYFGTPKGGWSTRVYEMTRRWVNTWAKVTVVTSLYDKSDLKGSGLVSRQNIDGVDIILINVKLSNKHGLLYRIYTFIMFALVSSWYGIKLKYDVVIASSGPITIGIPGLISHYLKRKPLIFEVRDLWPWGGISMGMLKNKMLQKLAWQLEAQCYKSSKAVIALSKGMAENIKKRFPDVRTYVIPNASDIALFNNPGFEVMLPEWAVGKLIFLYTGTLGAMDDCSQILRAAKALQDAGKKDILIVFLGEGKEKPVLEKMAAELLLNNVQFVGLKPKEEVVGWLKHACATFVVFKNIPVWDTCSPNKMFDSFAAGKPVIQTTRGWIKELLKKEKCGINCPPENPDAMKDAILYLAENKEQRDLMAENAKRVARDLFNRDTLADEMLDIITKIATGKAI
jgi:glycosyltransferase involved in cell wall biosynthesis